MVSGSGSVVGKSASLHPKVQVPLISQDVGFPLISIVSDLAFLHQVHVSTSYTIVDSLASGAEYPFLVSTQIRDDFVFYRVKGSPKSLISLLSHLELRSFRICRIFFLSSSASLFHSGSDLGSKILVVELTAQELTYLNDVQPWEFIVRKKHGRPPRFSSIHTSQPSNIVTRSRAFSPSLND